MSTQSWDDNEFCTTYARMWEISLSEVHYGWLSPGEHEVGLLKNETLLNANVLDVGCGLGQNLVTLAGEGSNGFGLDISPCMLEMANKIIKDNDFDSKITLEQGDMRAFSAFSEIGFDVILSVYSMEYLSGVKELRSVIHNLYKRLNPGGVFIMCFSHPSQAHRYPEFMNRSEPQGSGKFRPYNYSIKDATEALFKAGFSIERIVEQKTNNPSKISYKEAIKYPYHFKEGFSLFLEEFDEISNGSPHTIIYKARRHHDALHGIPKQEGLSIGYRELWGYKRKIVKYSVIHYLGLVFNVVHLAPRDNILGVLDILSFNISSRDIDDDYKTLELSTGDESQVYIPKNSVLGLIHKRMQCMGLEGIYKSYHVENCDNNEKEARVIIESVVGLDVKTSHEFSTDKIGILVFVNGHEPSMGELPLDVARVKAGDHIQITYMAYRKNKISKNTSQLELI